MNPFDWINFFQNGIVTSHEGMSPGWGLILFAIGVVLTIFAYQRASASISQGRRVLLVVLRILFFLGLVIMLVKPVIVLSSAQLLRQTLVVLLDDSASMQTKDHRTLAVDLVRADIAAGRSRASGDISQTTPAGEDGTSLDTTRLDILNAVAGNSRLDLFPRLLQKADLLVYRFGREATEMGRLAPEGSQSLDTDTAQKFFAQLQGKENATAIGTAIRQVLERNRENPLAGILLISDGGSNAGQPVADAVAMADEAGIPIYTYGIGVTEPPDFIVRSLDVPRLAFLNESAVIKVHYVAQSLDAGSTEMVLKVNGVEKSRQKVSWKDSGEGEADFEYKPDKAGALPVSVEAATVPGELFTDNNTAHADLNVVDTRIHVLYIEQQPRWDYRYLLAVLESDPRFDLKVVLLDGDPILQTLPHSPFLPALPDDEATYFKNDIIILGDVDPKRLGQNHMNTLKKWVDEIGGGMIFLAGPHFNPYAYGDTPLGDLLPVIPVANLPLENREQLFATPQKFKLTNEGQISSWLRLSQDQEENLRIWDQFKGMSWAAQTGGARAGAEVELIDPSAEHMIKGVANPVLAEQRYGRGETAYFGTDETYRWRSKIGEKYYIKIWGQILQGLALERLLGASYRTQLSPSREEYRVGDNVVISGRIFATDFTPIKVDEMPATLKIEPEGPDAVSEQSDVSIKSLPGRPGEFRYEFIARKAGKYALVTKDDPNAPVKFTVRNPDLEHTETSLNVDVMRSIADGSHGKFLREEDLAQLPPLIKSRKSDVPMVQKIEIFNSAWLLSLMIVIGAAEWLIRRLSNLK